MTDSYRLAHWIKLYPHLVAYEVVGQCVFPMLGDSGCVSPKNAVFLAKQCADFPEDQFPIEPGLSPDGKVYTIILFGTDYSYHDVTRMLDEANSALRKEEVA